MTNQTGKEALAGLKQILQRKAAPAAPAAEAQPAPAPAPAEPAAIAHSEPVPSEAYVPHRYVPREYREGNFCGHNPAAPALEIQRPATRRRPLILEVLHENISRYYHDPKLIPSLRDCSVYRDGRRHDRRRRMRSERREAIVQLLRACAYFVDLATLHLGRQTPAGFAWATKGQLRGLTTLGEKRFDRALRDARGTKIVKIFERATRPVYADGEFRAEPAIKIFSEHLFGVFGLSKWLKKEAEKARLRYEQRKAQRAQTEAKKPLSGAAKARGALAMGGLTESLAAGSKRPNQQSKKSRREDILRERNQMSLDAAQSDPSLDAATIRRTIDDAFRRRGIDIEAILRETYIDD